MKIAISTKIRAHRVLNPMRRYKSVDGSEFPDFDVARMGEAIGVYSNDLPCPVAKIVITDKGLLVLRETGGSSWMKFEDIVDATTQLDEKKNQTPNIFLSLQSGERLVVPINGREGNFQDKYEFLRFLTRVGSDLDSHSAPRSS